MKTNTQKECINYYIKIFNIIFDYSFPNGQFQIKIFNTPFRLDSDKNGVGLIIFSREDISAKLLYMDIISCVLNG